MDLNALDNTTMTLNKKYKVIAPEHIPYTFKNQGREKLEKKKVQELDIFFNVVRQDIEDEKEEYLINH